MGWGFFIIFDLFRFLLEKTPQVDKLYGKRSPKVIGQVLSVIVGFFNNIFLPDWGMLRRSRRVQIFL